MIQEWEQFTGTISDHQSYCSPGIRICVDMSQIYYIPMINQDFKYNGRHTVKHFNAAGTLFCNLKDINIFGEYYILRF